MATRKDFNALNGAKQILKEKEEKDKAFKSLRSLIDSCAEKKDEKTLQMLLKLIEGEIARRKEFEV